jgi:hypothetical protein
MGYYDWRLVYMNVLGAGFGLSIEKNFTFVTFYFKRFSYVLTGWGLRLFCLN